MTLDDILIHIGEFGRYQKWVYFLFALPYTPYAMQLFGWVFVGAKLEHRCRIPGEPEGAGFDLNGTRYNTMLKRCAYGVVKPLFQFKSWL